MRRAIGILLLLAIVCGCNPRVSVVQNPGPMNRGIRYYRPKPYLLIAPAGTTSEIAGNVSKRVTEPSDQFVSIQLQYLPDFNEEYAINVRSGLGTADVSITLEDGWNLTEINQKLDSQFDENLSAVAEVMKAVPSVASRSGAEGTADTHRWYVSATNVPLGYYEAAFGYDDCGRKQLYGWRYIGFMPFAPCPVCMTGSDGGNCLQNSQMIDEQNPLTLYGLVFERGVMVFRPMGAIQEKGAEPEGRSERSEYQVASPVLPTMSRTITETTQNGTVQTRQVDVRAERLPVPENPTQ